MSQLGIAIDDYQTLLLKAGFTSSEEVPDAYEFRVLGPEVLITVVYDADHPEKSKINYTPRITVAHRGVTSFAKEESVVTLFCVADLLGKGYRPEDLSLEKTWKLGHNEKGRLDILISNVRGGTLTLGRWSSAKPGPSTSLNRTRCVRMEVSYSHTGFRTVRQTFFTSTRVAYALVR